MILYYLCGIQSLHDKLSCFFEIKINKAYLVIFFQSIKVF